MLRSDVSFLPDIYLPDMLHLHKLDLVKFEIHKIGPKNTVQSEETSRKENILVTKCTENYVDSMYHVPTTVRKVFLQ